MFPTFCVSSQIAYVYHPKSLNGSLHCPLCESHTHLFSKAKSWSNRLPNSLTGTLNYFKVSLSIYITQTVSLLCSLRKYHTHFFLQGSFHLIVSISTYISQQVYLIIFITSFLRFVQTIVLKSQYICLYHPCGLTWTLCYALYKI